MPMRKRPLLALGNEFEFSNQFVYTFDSNPPPAYRLP
jgi:hypothetical protein